MKPNIDWFEKPTEKLDVLEAYSSAENSLWEAAAHTFMLGAARTDILPMQEYALSGFVAIEWESELSKLIEESNGRLVLQHTDGKTGAVTNTLVAFSEGVLKVNGMKDNRGGVTLLTRDEKLMKATHEFAHKILQPLPDTPGRIYMLVEEGGDLSLARIGFAARSLVKDNYAPEALKDFDYVVDELGAKDPLGRLLIMSGPTGSGKTYYARGIMEQVPRANYVFIPPSMLSSLESPKMLPVLLELAYDDDDEQSVPTILLVEDADEALNQRGPDNMTLVSALLNFTSGIPGECMDIRIITTTNAAVGDLDDAVKRSGRLIRHIVVPKLPYGQACQRYKSLLEESKKPFVEPPFAGVGGEVTLSDVYAAARKEGWVPDKTAKSVGFKVGSKAGVTAAPKLRVTGDG